MPDHLFVVEFFAGNQDWDDHEHPMRAFLNLEEALVFARDHVGGGFNKLFKVALSPSTAAPEEIEIWTLEPR